MQVQVNRLNIVSERPFEEVVDRLTATIGRPDIDAFHTAIAAAPSEDDLAAIVKRAIGPSELMEFARYDAGEVLRKERTGDQPKILRLVVGNPLIMKEMTKQVHAAAAYAPVTILIDERPDGVHISYDTMASLLAPYGSEAALAIARDLDTKVESLMKSAAR
jgi:hypothetical protein